LITDMVVVQLPVPPVTMVGAMAVSAASVAS